MDLRGIDNGAPCPSKESIWNDVKMLVRYLKFNDPEIPLLLGGHGYGASVALNYSGSPYDLHCCTANLLSLETARTGEWLPACVSDYRCTFHVAQRPTAGQ